MTEIPETRCLKILCKFSFVAKLRGVTNTLQIDLQQRNALF